MRTTSSVGFMRNPLTSTLYQMGHFITTAMQYRPVQIAAIVGITYLSVIYAKELTEAQQELLHNAQESMGDMFESCKTMLSSQPVCKLVTEAQADIIHNHLPEDLKVKLETLAAELINNGVHGAYRAVDVILEMINNPQASILSSLDFTVCNDFKQAYEALRQNGLLDTCIEFGNQAMQGAQPYFRVGVNLRG